VQAARGGWQPAEEKEVALDWRALLFVVAGLVANVALIVPLGFTGASTILFVLVAYGFGSRKPLRDAAIGFAVALVAYFGFAKLLGVNIGAGLIEGLLGG
jgi:putative tricarboxylic transport membrane protein